MIILCLRTDNPKAEIGLFDDDKKLVYKKWLAHRQLAEDIHITIREVLLGQKVQWDEIQGIVCFKGPGSFTGLRIGLSVANALANSLEVPIVGTTGDNWTKNGIKYLKDGKNQKLILPEYGAEVHITMPKT